MSTNTMNTEQLAYEHAAGALNDRWFDLIDSEPEVARLLKDMSREFEAKATRAARDRAFEDARINEMEMYRGQGRPQMPRGGW